MTNNEETIERALAKRHVETLRANGITIGPKQFETIPEHWWGAPSIEKPKEETTEPPA